MTHTNHLIQTSFPKKLLKNEISQQLRNIFNMYFSTGQFPSVLKIAKFTPIHKKQSKGYYKNYRLISFLRNIKGH